MNKCDHTRLFALSKPVRQVQKDAGEKTRFGNAEEKTGHVQLTCVMHKTRQHSHDTPADQNASDPGAGADPVQQHVAGNFK